MLIVLFYDTEKVEIEDIRKNCLTYEFVSFLDKNITWYLLHIDKQNNYQNSWYPNSKD